ncbi:MAG: HAD-IA family hydrolase [Synergistaceae bacterium]|jgi:HAD superfamily hydrolase (TIGR01549 family)|nr:HAD-IA family hydrolase [Synergistaceae bacterium]
MSRQAGGETRAALFDFDLTLMDTSYAITECTNAFAEKMGLRHVTREETLRVIGLPIAESWIGLWGRYEQEWLDIYRQNFRDMEHEGFREFPDTRSALTLLRENGIKLGVASNRRFAMRAVKACGIAPMFDVVIGLEDVQYPKPNPDPVFTALSRLSAKPGRSFYIGDTDIDMKTAVAAGVTGIGVTTGNFSAGELKAAGGAYTCPNLSAVADTILNISID